jgi:hypothetical protein
MWTKERVVELLATNDKAVGRALLRLLQNQTSDEQVAQNVKYRNNTGFRPCHARMGTSMAEFFQSKGYLTAKQAAYWRVRDKNGNMRIGIYANQLLKEIGA